MKFQWEDQFSVGHATIDQHHKTIISLLERLQDKYTGDSKLQINYSVLEEFTMFVNRHLDFEEELLTKARYPVFEEHQKHHALYRQNMKYYFENEKNTATALSVFNFLTRWWKHHITEDDMLFKPYVEHLSD